MKTPHWLSPGHDRRRWLFLPFAASQTRPTSSLSNQNRNLSLQIPEKPDSQTQTPQLISDEKAHKGFSVKNRTQPDIEDSTSPIRWFIICTLFPLLASTFGPMASAFNICAVAIDWRTQLDLVSEETQPQGTKIRDPRWLVGVNVASLVIAIIANLFLLAQMAGRIRFSIGSPVTIIGWYISGFIDIALVAAAPTVLALPDGGTAAFSQAYYYACFAGGLYVVLAMMLSCTAVGVWGYHFTEEFKLTLSQRSLMLQTMLYLGYLLCAGAVYSRVEGYNYLDGVYFINVTLFTIGFGDLAPKTHTGRALLFPTAVGGIIFVGLIIANIRSLVVESCGRKISLRVVEKARHKALRKGKPDQDMVRLKGKQMRAISGDTELERRQQEFEVMREILSSAAIDNRRITFFASALSFFLLWVLGAVVFWEAESTLGGQDWTFFESFYFTYVAQLTIGYGDFYPQTNSAKPAFVFWSLIALPTLTVLIGSIGDVVTDLVNIGISKASRHQLELRSAMNAIKKTINSASHPESETLDFTDDIATAAREQATTVLSAHTMATPGLDPKFYDPTPEESMHAYRPYMVIREIKKLVADMDANPNKTYPYSEWTRLLRLIDEDESDVNGHRIPFNPEHKTLHAKTPPIFDRSVQAWSWLGQESPLMSTDSEPKWLMDRLLGVLEKELKDRGDRLILSKVVTAPARMIEGS